MAKKTIRLTESDLVKLVNRVIKEQELDRELGGPAYNEDAIQEINDHALIIKEGDAKTVEFALANLPKKIKFIAIINSEYADFTNINICNFPGIHLINLVGTPNNFEEVVECPYQELGNGMYDMDKD